MSAIHQVLSRIEEFQPTSGNWLGLESLLSELWSLGVTEEAQQVLLHVFDRFPEEDGAGVFWSIVHGLESLPGYESALFQSASKHPTKFKTIMVNRAVKAGTAQQGAQADEPASGGSTA